MIPHGFPVAQPPRRRERKRRILRILFALTYYRPYISGITVYVQRLAEALARRGQDVTVLTSRYDPALCLEEELNGVRVVRVPMAFRISKGAIMPGYPLQAWPLIRQSDIVAMNLPNTPLEAVQLPLLARLARRPITATYHCDVQLPRSVVNRVADEVVFASNCFAGSMVDRIVAYTEDYANYSRFLSKFPGKREVIPPPIVVGEPPPNAVEAFRRRHAPRGERLIGFAARFAAEKGLGYLVRALPLIEERLGGNIRVLFAGDCENVIGEEGYHARLMPAIERLGDRWEFLGMLETEAMATFYGACDVTVLPSINRTESFGLVQVESMLCGTPVVASDLPGVRVPIQTTGMGRIAPRCDAKALAEAVADVLLHREQYVRPAEEVREHFSLERTVDLYLAMFERLLQQRGKRVPVRSAPLRRESDAPEREDPTIVHSAQRDFLREHLRETPPFRALIRSIECRLFARAAPLERPVLDLGCGDGLFAKIAFAEPLDVGVDVDPREVGLAARRGSCRQALVASGTRLPFASGRFATVVANCVVEHVPDLDALLAEVSRVLRPGGRFVFGVPSHLFARMLLGSTLLRRARLGKLAEAYGRWFNGHSRHYHLHSPAEWERRLAEHSLRVEAWRYYMTPRATRAFDLAHYLGVPRLITFKMTGHWVLFPASPINWWYERWLRPLCESDPPKKGADIFFEATKQR